MDSVVDEQVPEIIEVTGKKGSVPASKGIIDLRKQPEIAGWGERSTNPFLSEVMRRFRALENMRSSQLGESSKNPVGVDSNPTMFEGKPYDFPLVYFETKGCSFDKAGACTMCNFGHGANFTDEQILDGLENMFTKLIDEGKPALVISANGSIFDDKEVSPELRNKIFQKIKEKGFRYVSTESRAEFITIEKVDEMRQILGNDVEIEMGIGLETVDPYVSKYSINKMFDPEIYQQAVSILHEYGVKVFAHVLLKPPFLSEKEAYADALKTIIWALSPQGGKAQRVGLGLMNLRQATLPHWLAAQDMYTTPSYRTLVKVLKAVPEDLKGRINLFGFYSNSGVEIQGHTGGCEVCSEPLKNLIIEYSKTQNSALLDEAEDYPCEKCKDQWEQGMDPQRSQVPFTSNLRENYKKIAVGIFGPQYLSSDRNLRVIDRSLPPEQ